MAKSENQKLKLLYICRRSCEDDERQYLSECGSVAYCDIREFPDPVSLFSVECKKRTEERVKLLCDNALAGVILDRFGTTIYVKVILHN